MLRLCASVWVYIRGARRIFSTRWSRWAYSSAKTAVTEIPLRLNFFSTDPTLVHGRSLGDGERAPLLLWGSLTEALRTGLPQNEAKGGSENFFDVIYADPVRLAQFARAMSALSADAARALAVKFPWQDHSSVIDIGCAEGTVPVQIAQTHEHITGGGFDLPKVGPIFGRLRAQSPPVTSSPIPCPQQMCS